MTHAQQSASTSRIRSQRDGVKPSRLVGLDIARGVAVLGMIIAHVGLTKDEKFTIEGLLWLSHGHSSILFATVAGVSLGLLSGGTASYAGRARQDMKIKIFTRAAMLFVIAGVFSMLNTPIHMILVYYAVWFVAALPFTNWSALSLATLGVCWAVIGAIVLVYVHDLLIRAQFTASGNPNLVVVETTLGMFPGIMWMGFVLVGMALAKTDLRDNAHLRRVLAGSTITATVTYTAAWLAQRALSLEIDRRCWPEAGSPEINRTGPIFNIDHLVPSWECHLQSHAHSVTPVEALGSGSVAVAIITACLLLPAVAQSLLAPLAAVGSMALTAYCAHVLAIYLWPEFFFTEVTGHAPMLIMVSVSVSACYVWRSLWGQGPLERVMRGAADYAVRM